MDNKAATNIMLSVVLGVVLVLILIFPVTLFADNLIGILTKESPNDINNEKLFIESLLVKAKNLPSGEKISLLYSPGEEYMVVGFPKNQDRVGESGQKCSYVDKQGKVIQELTTLSFDQ